jgi:hypothetical protein
MPFIPAPKSGAFWHILVKLQGAEIFKKKLLTSWISIAKK